MVVKVLSKVPISISEIIARFAISTLPPKEVISILSILPLPFKDASILTFTRLVSVTLLEASVPVKLPIVSVSLLFSLRKSIVTSFLVSSVALTVKLSRLILTPLLSPATVLVGEVTSLVVPEVKVKSLTSNEPL